MNLDKQMRETVLRDRNKGVSWYLMASYAYYHEDDPILSDAAFDWLAAYLLERWPAIRHQHKRKITKGSLEAGSLLLSKARYPVQARGALRALRRSETE